MRVHDYQPPPPGLLEQAERTIRCNSFPAMKNLSCELEGSTLILRGCVPTYYLRELAETTVSHLPGVERVVNEIEVLCSRR